MSALRAPGPGDTYQVPEVGVPDGDTILDTGVDVLTHEGVGIAIAALIVFVVLRKLMKVKIVFGLIMLAMGIVLATVIMKNGGA